MSHRWIVCVVAIVLLELPFAVAKTTTPAAKSPAAPASVPVAMQRALDAFSGDAMRGHVRYLSDDLLEGRGPGTRGDDLAMKYIAAQFEAYGLEADGAHGPSSHKVPLIGTSAEAENTSLS